MIKAHTLSELERTAEKADLAEMQRLNDEIDERETRKGVIASRIASRYKQGHHEGTKVAGLNRKDPDLNDPLQRQGYEYLKTAIKSRTKPIVHFVESNGHTLRSSSKPGVQVSQAFKKRPDVFGYESEEWFLLPPWGPEQRKTGA